MSEEQEVKGTHFDVPSNVCQRPLSVTEVNALRDMIENHPGWKVWMEIISLDKEHAVDIGMDPTTIPEVRSVCRGEHQGCLKTLSFERELAEAIDGAQPVTLKDL